MKKMRTKIVLFLLGVYVNRIRPLFHKRGISYCELNYLLHEIIKALKKENGTMA